MLARRARGSGGDSPTAQQVAHLNNEQKLEQRKRLKQAYYQRNMPIVQVFIAQKAMKFIANTIQAQ
jgi:hypothetical protein